MRKNYILKTIKYDRSTSNNFIWPTKGYVKCPDWNPLTTQGNGFFGALNGEGHGRHCRKQGDMLGLIAEVDITKGVDLGGKWKFPECM